MEYEKPWLSYEQQADLLINERGLIADRDNLIRHLQEVGYYRLSGYWYIFKRCNVSSSQDNSDERFIEGATFDEVWSLYTFDRQLRLLTLDAIERIEVYFRSQLAYELAEKTGPFGYLDPVNLPRLDEDEYREFLERCKTQYSRSSEPFVRHFKEKYGDCEELPPYWIIVNLMEFGTMLRLYKGASPDVRNTLAAKLDVTTRVLKSWLVALNTTRNICAHHARLWNKGIGTRPVIPNKEKNLEWYEPFQIRADRICGILTILSYLLERVAPDTSWRSKLFDLLNTRSSNELNRMGFVEGWKESPLWQPWVAKYDSETDEA